MNQVLRHRLRNAASGIKGAASYLSEELAGRVSGVEAEYFPMIIKECDALGDITVRLGLLFDGPPAGEPAAVGQILPALERDLAARYPRLNLRVDLADTVRAVRVASGTALQIALGEVVANGAEASAGAKVTLACGAEDGKLRFFVTDEGEAKNGVDPETFFEPFYTTRARQLGIGLNVARECLRRIGGHIEAAWQSRGGLGVTLTVPADH